uniref:SWI/SNF complex subunit SWI3D-like n=1 Tax=Rhizophora mucronata TaxID=61149 RepID=A0A2P2IW55_RHIMU
MSPSLVASAISECVPTEDPSPDSFADIDTCSIVDGGSSDSFGIVGEWFFGNFEMLDSLNSPVSTSS